MKKKYTFSALFVLLISLSCTIFISFYSNVRQNVQYDEYALGWSTREALSYLMMEKCEELNPDYSIFTFNDSIDQNTKEQLSDSINSIITQYVTQLENDENFGYEIKYKDQTISHNMPKDIDTNNTLFYNEVSFDAFGNQSSKNYFDYDYWEDLLIYNYNFDQEDEKAVYFYSPEDISFTFYIPKNLISNNKIIVQSLDVPDAFIQFSMCGLGILILIIIVFTLLYPLSLEKQTKQFNSLIKMKFEWGFLFYSIVLSLLTSGCLFVSGYTLNGSFDRWLTKYSIQHSSIIILVVNFIFYFFCTYCFGCMIISIKELFSKGFDHFIKNTVCYSIYRYLDNKFFSSGLSKGLQKQIIFIVGLNTIICILLCLIQGIGILLAILYGIIAFVFLQRKVNKIKDNYTSLLAFASSLSNGDFNHDLKEDTGPFNELSQELSNIQIGFEVALKERVKSENLKTELITNVSHDLKTPITGIKNYIELINDPNLDEKTRQQYIDRLTSYTDRLNNLVIDLLEVSKANSGNIELEYQDINITEFLEQIHAENMDLLEEKNLKLVFLSRNKNAICSLDPNRSVRIFENVLSNISKYTLENTRVFVDILDNKDSVTIIYKNISNTYLNFDPNEITERFVRGDASRHERGSGLGLAIIKSFVEIQHGYFEVQIDGDVFKTIITFPKK